MDSPRLHSQPHSPVSPRSDSPSFDSHSAQLNSPRPAFPQPELPELPSPEFPQPSFPYKPSFPEPSFPQPSLPQPSFPQADTAQYAHEFPTIEYSQPGFPQPIVVLDSPHPTLTDPAQHSPPKAHKTDLTFAPQDRFYGPRRAFSVGPPWPASTADSPRPANRHDHIDILTETPTSDEQQDALKEDTEPTTYVAETLQPAFTVDNSPYPASLLRPTNPPRPADTSGPPNFGGQPDAPQSVKIAGPQEDGRDRVEETMRKDGPVDATKDTRQTTFVPPALVKPPAPPSPAAPSTSSVSTTHGVRQRPLKVTDDDSGSTTKDAKPMTSIAAAPEGSAPQRPSIQPTGSQIQSTRYVNMLLALDAVPRLHNWMASFFTWILLAGFVIFPGTFSSISQIPVAAGTVESRVLHAVQNIPLFVIAFLCCGVGAAGMIWLWWRWMNNYIWLLDRIFVPGALNGLAGVLTTIASVFGAQGGKFTASSITTLSVTGACTVLCGGLTAFYALWVLDRVKKEHEKQVGKERAGKHGEGLLEEMRRQANQPAGPEARLF
ncbi:hypothetical protein OF83DRAFT_1107106 [Amylostereum chailletii]|nr:hypothetical protein OF83DRAFT_1107106 [Amylostereum chailletii]